jgi:hypothetical protein
LAGCIDLDVHDNDGRFLFDLECKVRKLSSARELLGARDHSAQKFTTRLMVSASRSARYAQALVRHNVACGIADASAAPWAKGATLSSSSCTHQHGDAHSALRRR